ncbi:MAG: hypothetical protein K2X66_06810, partial [Cyanobacteria bacterium]|nr:hypothetical protein [Cyanobacteriota bacterium]
CRSSSLMTSIQRPLPVSIPKTSNSAAAKTSFLLSKPNQSIQFGGPEPDLSLFGIAKGIVKETWKKGLALIILGGGLIGTGIYIGRNHSPVPTPPQGTITAPEKAPDQAPDKIEKLKN